MFFVDNLNANNFLFFLFHIFEEELRFCKWVKIIHFSKNSNETVHTELVLCLAVLKNSSYVLFFVDINIIRLLEE